MKREKLDAAIDAEWNKGILDALEELHAETDRRLTVVDIAAIQAQVDADIPPEVATPNRPAKSP